MGCPPLVEIGGGIEAVHLDLLGVRLDAWSLDRLGPATLSAAALPIGGVEGVDRERQKVLLRAPLGIGAKNGAACSRLTGSRLQNGPHIAPVRAPRTNVTPAQTGCDEVSLNRSRVQVVKCYEAEDSPTESDDDSP